MTKRTLGIVSLFALAAAACSQQPADDSNINIDDGVNAAEAANADIETLPPSESAGGTESGDNAGAGNGSDTGTGNEATPTPPATNAAIPAQYRGRWGMVAADCEPGRSDAKGLMSVDSTTLRFYESRAVLKEQRPAIATSFSGLFAFAGEGQNWEKVETLTRTGDRLKRADKDGTYNYTRCA